MSERILIRTISNLSFAGEILEIKLAEKQKGIFLKPSPHSDIKIWFPSQEIKTIIHPDGKFLEGEELINELGF